MYKPKYNNIMNKFAKYITNERFVANFIGKDLSIDSIDKIEDEFACHTIIQRIKKANLSEKECKTLFDFVTCVFLKAMIDSYNSKYKEDEEYNEIGYTNHIIKFNVSNTKRKDYMLKGNKNENYIFKIKAEINNKIFKE